MEEISKILAQELYNRMNLEKLELKKAFELYGVGDYLGFLKEVRNNAIDNVRRKDFGEFMWHDGNRYILPSYIDNALYTVGLITKEDYSNKHAGQSVMKGLECWRVAGSPEAPIKPDFFTLGANVENGYMRFSEFVPLTIMYWKTGEKIYLDKWFQIMEAYSDNYFRESRERFIDIKETQWELRPLQYNYGTLLACGHRTDFTIKQFALLVKNLPGNYEKTTDYMHILGSVEGKPYPESYDLIDPVKACKFILCIERDHFEYLFTGYFEIKRQEVPNQMFMGLTGMTHIVRGFDFFTSIDDRKSKFNQKIVEFFKKYVHKDGGQSEQAFSYNVQALLDFYCVNNYAIEYSKDDPTLKEIDSVIDYCKKLCEVVRTPLGRRPNVGGGETISPQRAWESDELYNQAIETANWGAVPKYNNFTSIAFPYSGYYVLRSGWDKDSTHLFTQNARRSFGHMYVSNNSIELVSKRRNLIMGGGMPFYSIGDAPEGFKEDWLKYVDYFGEAANMSRSTIVVDGKPQTRGTETILNGETITKKVKGGVALTIEAFDTIKSKWLDSDTFTYYEGNYDKGYLNSDSASHYRQIILVKGLDMALISDIINMPEPESHEITQVWCFPPFLTKEIDGIGIPGFKKDEVKYDKNEKLLKTEDPTGPNVFLKLFSNYEMEGKKYFGHKSEDDYYLGWFSPKIEGEKYPKVDFHLSWKATDKNTPLVTAISSSWNTNSEISNYVDLSNEVVSGFEADAKNAKIAFISSKTAQRIKYKDIEVVAKTLVILKENGVQKGIVTDCDEFILNGIRQEILISSFEFLIENDSFIIMNDLLEPNTFKWNGDGDAIYPEYQN